LIERCSTVASGFGEVKMIRSFQLLDMNARDTAPRRNPVLRFGRLHSGSRGRITRHGGVRCHGTPADLICGRLLRYLSTIASSEPHRKVKVSPLHGLGEEVLEDLGGASIDEMAAPSASVPSVSCVDFAVGPGIQIKPASKSAHEAC
jgi:hypothetical protein